MKLNLKSSLLLAGVLCAVPFASAQIPLHGFSAFESPATTVFVGEWALNGDPISGDASPIATFSQGAGFYNFTGGSNADTAGVYYFYSSNPGDITGLSLLQVSAKLLAGNTAPSFTISLFDSLGESGFAVISTAPFANPGFTTVTAALSFSLGFDYTDLASFQITGGTFSGTDSLNLAVDHLALVAVPEPATYGLIGGVLVLALTITRRFRRRF